MREIRTPEDLIRWLEQNAPRPCIRRAVTYGTVVNYGFFGRYGFIIEVKSRVSPTVWLLSVQKSHKYQTYVTYTIVYVPWGSYEGGKCKLFEGEVPEICKLHKDSLESIIRMDPPQKRNWIRRFLDWVKES